MIKPSFLCVLSALAINVVFASLAHCADLAASLNDYSGRRVELEDFVGRRAGMVFVDTFGLGMSMPVVRRFSAELDVAAVDRGFLAVWSLGDVIGEARFQRTAHEREFVGSDTGRSTDKAYCLHANLEAKKLIMTCRQTAENGVERLILLRLTVAEKGSLGVTLDEYASNSKSPKSTSQRRLSGALRPSQ